MKTEIFNGTPVILLEDNLSRQGETGALLFSNPVAIIQCQSIEACPTGLEKIDQAVADGFYVAGWMAYEAAAAFEDRLQAISLPNPEEPLIWFGIFQKPKFLTTDDVTALLAEHQQEIPAQALVGDFQFSEDEAAYFTALDTIQEHLAAGDIYQANYTFRMLFDLIGDPLTFYMRLRASQPVGYGAYIDIGEWRMISRSPELFLARNGGELLSKPMKGTAKRGLTTRQDQESARALAADEKSRAENLMIVDLIRNDMSRITGAGPVCAVNLFAIERYPSLFQMTTDVRAGIPEKTKFSGILKAMFPCGSITGTPKISAVGILQGLEKSPRGLYTGTIGYAAPDGAFCFNIPIRTIITNRNGTSRMGIGSGVVADSDAKTEYEECLLKARFLTTETPQFDLIETLLWQPQSGYGLLDLHMARMAASAVYFDFCFAGKKIERALADITENFREAQTYRVRLLLSPSGNITITSEAITEHKPGPHSPKKIRLHPEPVHSDNPFLYHKTTNRAFYDQAWRKVREKHACHDVLFQNQHGELTETAIANLFIRRGDVLLTPPVSCGLLPGTFRESLLKAAGGRVQETPLTPDDLATCDEILIANSIRGLTPVQLVTS